MPSCSMGDEFATIETFTATFIFKTLSFGHSSARNHSKTKLKVHFQTQMKGWLMFSFNDKNYKFEIRLEKM